MKTSQNTPSATAVNTQAGEQNEATQATEKATIMSEDEKQLTALGLTLKEARQVIQMRNARSENIGIRVNREELSAIDELHDYLVLHGYIKEGRANLLVYLVATAVKPKPTQLEADLK